MSVADDGTQKTLQEMSQYVGVHGTDISEPSTGERLLEVPRLEYPTSDSNAEKESVMQYSQELHYLDFPKMQDVNDADIPKSSTEKLLLKGHVSKTANVAPSANSNLKEKKGPVMKSSQGFHYPDVRKTAEYICGEIQKNIMSADVLSIRNLNRGIVEKPLKLASYTEKGQALLKWKDLVKSGSKWDHKMMVRTMQKNKLEPKGYWACNRTTFLKFNYDIWSNIHYGFVGKYAGFTEFELTNAAGGAQILDNAIGPASKKIEKIIMKNEEDLARICDNIKECSENDGKNGASLAQRWDNIKECGKNNGKILTEFGAGLTNDIKESGNILTEAMEKVARMYSPSVEDGRFLIDAFDDPCDANAVRVGFKLYDKFKDDPSKMTASHILRELYGFYFAKKELSIEECGFQCDGCKKISLKPLK